MAANQARRDEERRAPPSVAAGAVSYFMTQGGAAAPAPAADAAAPQVFKAKSVIDDTQGPRGAKGQDVDRTPGTDIKKARRRGGGGRSGGGGGAAGNAAGPKPTSSRSTKLELSDSKNPLGD